MCTPSVSALGKLGNETYFSPLSVPLANGKIGDMIKSVTEEQMQFISKKMRDILSGSLVLDQNALVRTGTYRDSYGQSGVVCTDAKSEFLSRTPFWQDMKNDFQFGAGSKIACGDIYEYSFEDILKYSVRTGGHTLREIMGDQLAQWPHYRISLGLDLSRTEILGELFFKITEHIGNMVHTTISFSLEKEIIRMKENGQIENPPEPPEYYAPKSEQYATKITKAQRDIEEITKEMERCNLALQSDTSNKGFYQKQLSDLQGKLDFAEDKLEFYSRQLRRLTSELLDLAYDEYKEMMRV